MLQDKKRRRNCQKELRPQREDQREGLDGNLALLQRGGERTDDLTTAEPREHERHTGANTATDERKHISCADRAGERAEQRRHIENSLSFLQNHSFLKNWLKKLTRGLPLW